MAASFFAVLAIAITVEGITEYLKTVFPGMEHKTTIIYAITAALGIAAAISFDADLFAAFGITSRIPYFGTVLTGIACSRGSNYVYDLLKKLTGAKQDADDFSQGLYADGEDK